MLAKKLLPLFTYSKLVSKDNICGSITFIEKCLFFNYFRSIFQSNSSSGVLNGHETDSACEEDIFDDDIKGQLISRGHFIDKKKL